MFSNGKVRTSVVAHAVLTEGRSAKVRYREERSDAAIHSAKLASKNGLLRCARKDGFELIQGLLIAAVR